MNRLSASLWVLLVLTAIVAAVEPVLAQQNSPYWRFAYDFRENTLIAYTLQGETRPIVTWETESLNQGIVRLSPESAIVHLRDQNEQRLLYYISAGLATGSAQQILDNPLDLSKVIALSADWVILRSSLTVMNQPDTAAVNRHTGDTQILTGIQVISGRCYLDGALARYVSRDTANDWTLWERDLTTGEERVVNSLSPFDGDPSGQG